MYNLLVGYKTELSVVCRHTICMGIIRDSSYSFMEKSSQRICMPILQVASFKNRFQRDTGSTVCNIMQASVNEHWSKVSK